MRASPLPTYMTSEVKMAGMMAAGLKLAASTEHCMLPPNIEFITPTAMNMPSMSMLVKTIVTMEELFQLRSLHMIGMRCGRNRLYLSAVWCCRVDHWCRMVAGSNCEGRKKTR